MNTASFSSPENWRRSALALLVSASLVVHPAMAQDASAALRDLIPDAAVADPEAWAQGGVPADSPVPGSIPPAAPDPASPIAENLVSLPWPEDTELPQLAPLTPPETDIQFAEFETFEQPVELGSEERISPELVLMFPTESSLFPQRPEFLRRFRGLSTIERLDDDDSAAKLAAQARVDEQLLLRLLRIYGYYDAVVSRTVAGLDAPADPAQPAAPEIRFNVLPGKQYAVGAVDLGRLAEAGADFPELRDTFEIKTGDPLLADKILEEQFDLDETLGESGYPFAKIEDPSLVVDHARIAGDLTLPVTPGGKYNFGQITSSLPGFMPAKHLADIARFEPGDLYQRSLDLDLRRALLATGIVSAVTITPVVATPPAGDQPGTVDMAVDLTPGKLRTLAGQIGYGTGEGIKIEGSWEHRNLFPPEGLLRVRGIAGTREQLAGVTVRKNNFHGRDQILSLDAFINTQDYDAYTSRTASVVGKFERVSTVLFQKPFSWSAGFELVATGERQRDAAGNLGPRQTYFVGALPLFAQFDTSDDLLNPTRGFRVGLRLSPETSRTNSVQSYYVRSQVDASYYRSMGERIVVAGRVRLASIAGAELANIAPSRRLYAGGGGSVRGYGYKAIGPRDDQGDPTGGRSLTEVALEARIRTGYFGGALQIVPFVDAGTVGDNPIPGFNQIKIGAGVGARYLTGFGPIRIDVAVPLNRGPNDARVAVYVGLGQAF